MLLKIIYSLKYIGAEHLLENKCQPYAEGVQSAWSTYNSIVMLVPWNEIEMRVKMKLAHAYADRENADNNAEETFQTGMIDFYEFVLDNE